jgi:hypothetical protein
MSRSNSLLGEIQGVVPAARSHVFVTKRPIASPTEASKNPQEIGCLPDKSLEATSMQDDFYESERFERWLVTFQEQLERWAGEARSKQGQELIDFFNDGRLTTAPNAAKDEKIASD